MCERDIMSAVAQGCQNPYWKQYYEEAPTKECKRYIALRFLFSISAFTTEELILYKEEKNTLQNLFGIEDWRHLFRYAGHNPLKIYYRKMIKNYME